MAPSTVNVAEHLRPWIGAGLNFILADDAFLAAQAERAQAVSQEAPQQHGVHPHAASAPEEDAFSPEHYQVPAPKDLSQYPSAPPPKKVTEGETPPPTGPRYQAAKQPDFRPGKYPSAPPKKARKATTASHAQQAQQTPEGSILREAPLPTPTTLPPEHWPANWQTMWGKVSAPAPIIWTYWSLGEDLGMTPNKARGELLRAIIGQLTLPKGSSTFWPVSVAPEETEAPSEGDTLIANTEIFLGGVTRINPRYIITFGSKALKTFAPNSGLGPYMFTQYMNRRLIALPDIDRMLDDRKHVAAIVAYLRTAITLK